jgi:hypothetical protein
VRRQEDGDPQAVDRHDDEQFDDGECVALLQGRLLAGPTDKAGIAECRDTACMSRA